MIPKVSIEGVEVKELVTHADERGFFREVIRETDGFFDHFGQWSHSLMYPGTVKAWHIHKLQTDWWYVVGAVKVALYDTREESPTKGQLMEFLMGDLQPGCVKIPPGVAHGYKVIGGDPAMLVYMTDRFYNPADEGRTPHNQPGINYDWETQYK